MIPLAYIIFFPFCQKSWHPNMKDSEKKHLTVGDYASTYFSIRRNYFNPILYGKALLHQFSI
jgi:hypothetical protein